MGERASLGDSGQEPAGSSGETSWPLSTSSRRRLRLKTGRLFAHLVPDHRRKLDPFARLPSPPPGQPPPLPPPQKTLSCQRRKLPTQLRRSRGPILEPRVLPRAHPSKETGRRRKHPPSLTRLHQFQEARLSWCPFVTSIRSKNGAGTSRSSSRVCQCKQQSPCRVSWVGRA